MLKERKNILLKLAGVLMAYALIIPFNGCWGMVGEPQLPQKINKNSTEL